MFDEEIFQPSHSSRAHRNELSDVNFSSIAEHRTVQSKLLQLVYIPSPHFLAMNE